VIVKVLEGPEHGVPPFVNVGVTTIVALIGELPVFVAVNERLPVPEAFRPIAILSFVHAYVVVPPVLEVANGTVEAAALQNV